MRWRKNIVLMPKCLLSCSKFCFKLNKQDSEIPLTSFNKEASTLRQAQGWPSSASAKKLPERSRRDSLSKRQQAL